MKNNWEQINEDVIVYLKGKTTPFFITDKKGLEKLLTINCTWGSYTTNGYIYVSAKIGDKRILLHRFLVDAEKGDIVDHIDINTLNNKLSNLRKTTRKINRYNSNKQKNVRFLKDGKGTSLSKPWAVYFRVDGKQKYFGYYATKDEALEKANEVRKVLAER